MKTISHRDTIEEKTKRMLELMAQPQRWQLSDGETAIVSTPATIRAKELLDLYNSLNSPLVNTNNRLEILLNVKWTVKESLTLSSSSSSGTAMNLNVNQEIIDLVDREADLLNRGRSFHPPFLFFSSTPIPYFIFLLRCSHYFIDLIIVWNHFVKELVLFFFNSLRILSLIHEQLNLLMFLHLL